MHRRPEIEANRRARPTLRRSGPCRVLASPRRLVVLTLMALAALLVATPAASLASSPDVLTGGPVSAGESSLGASPVLPQRRPDGEPPALGVCQSAASQQVPGGGLYLPINRWGGVSEQHTRLSSNPSQIPQKLQKNGTITVALGAGNSFWQATAGMTAWAARLCFSDQASVTVDQMVAKLGRSVTSSVLMTMLLVIGVVAVLARMMRGTGSLSALVKIAVAAGVLLIMVTGAGKTTVSADGASFGTGSPGWMANVVNTTVSAAAAAPAASLNDSIKTTGINDPDAKTKFGVLNCSDYVNTALLKQYDTSYGPGVASDLSAAVPKAIDSMWQATGMRTYVISQFGSQNPYGSKVFCRLLEMQSQTPTSASDVTLAGGQKAHVLGQVELTQEASGVTVKSDDYPFAVSYDETKIDRAMVAWAACTFDANGAATVDPDWAAVGNRDPEKAVTPQDCTDFLTKKGWKDADSHFNWEDDPGVIAKDAATKPAVADFLYSLHGDQNSAAVATTIIYVIASLIVMVVFGVFSLAVIVAKVALLGMTFLFIFVALAALLPNQTDNNLLLDTAKRYVSIALFAFGAGLLMAITAILTQMVSSMGTVIAGAGTTMSVLATGLAPLAAILVLHLFFTRLLKAPSPFKPTSALQYAKSAAAGSLGGAAVDRMTSRFGSRGRQMSRAATRSMVDRVTGRGPSTGLPGEGRRGAIRMLGQAAVAGGAGAITGAAASRHTADEGRTPDAQAPLSGAPVAAGTDLPPGDAAPAGIAAPHGASLPDRHRERVARSAEAVRRRAVRDGERQVYGNGLTARSLGRARERVTIAGSYFKDNRRELLTGAAKFSAGGTLLAAGAAASLTIPFAPAVAGIAALGAVRAAHRVNRARREIGQEHRDVTRQFHQDAVRQYAAQKADQQKASLRLDHVRLAEPSSATTHRGEHAEQPVPLVTVRPGDRRITGGRLAAGPAAKSPRESVNLPPVPGLRSPWGHAQDSAALSDPGGAEPDP